MISTDEQDGWAYVATGSEVYSLWERQRQRVARKPTGGRVAKWWGSVKNEVRIAWNDPAGVHYGE